MNSQFYKDQLLGRADRQLAHRTRWASILYPLIFLIIVTVTPYWRDQTSELIVLGAVLVLGAAIRSVLLASLNNWYVKNPRHWRIAFSVTTFLLAAAWGIFCMFAVTHYKLQWTAMLVLLATAGVAAAGVTTLSIYYFLVVTFLILLLAPSIVAMAVLATQESMAVMIMFFIFAGFLLVVGRRLNKEYWRALENTFLLDQRARQLQDSNKELESYSYSIAHDLRAPLRSITAFSQILREEAIDKLTDDEKDHLTRIINAGHYMAELIDDILELSRITRIDITHTKVNISALANECLQALQDAEPDRNVKLQVEPDIYVKGDANLLRIVLNNLLNNAWKFTSRCENPQILVGRYFNGDANVVFVKDNGVGFDMKYADKIFGIFQRLYNRDEFEGTGIGLASVQRVINRHSGKIWAEAQPGQGAAFYFSLPHQ